MKVGVPKETASGERRVALVPDSTKRLAEAGVEIFVESGAGAAAGFLDKGYEESGAQLVGDAISGVDAVAKVQQPSEGEVARLGDGQILIAFLQPLVNGDLVRALAERRVTAFSMDSIPRITRAQPMDALSSQSTVSGYKGTLIAADHLPKFMPMLTTAAGTIPPARILVLGAGVAGLQAIATARRLGAVVSAFDVRPAVKEQVESLGATFLELDVEGAEGQGGYAVALSDDQHEREQELIARHVAESDAVITTALIPGREAPVLITAAAARGMRPGSVIVDLAAEAGGNCELAKPGETYMTDNGVTIAAPLNLPSEMAEHASQLYAKNVQSLLELMTDKESGALTLDFEDEIIKGACITRGGEIVHEGARQAVGAS